MRRRLCLAVCAAFSLAACSQNSGTHPGILRFASLSDPDTLNPLLSAYQVSVDLSMFWAGYLFNYSDRNELVPELATQVPTIANGGVAKNGLTITYHLRKGVQWQDGAPFTADDVVFTWHAVMNPNNNVQTRTGYDLIASIEEPDKYSVAVHLKRRFAPFVNSFFTMSGTPYPLLPKHLLAKYADINRVPYNSKPVGTGPFIVQEWHRGETLRMIANPHYWRGAPKLREVQYRVIPDENTLVTTMQTHEIDLWYGASATNYPVASKIPDTRAILTPFTQYSRIGFNVQHPIVSDLAVRRAIAYATDRKRMIETVSFGVNLLAEGDQPRYSWAYDPHLKSYPFDPARARAILDAAGWKAGADGIRSKNGRRLHLVFATTAGNGVGNRMAVLLQAAWRNVGIDLEVKSYASALMFANYQSGGIIQSGKFDVEISSWVNGVDPDDSTNFMCDQIPPTGQNSYRFCNKELDAQERVALMSLDQDVRKKAYWRIQEILIDQLPMVTMWFQRRFDVASDDLKGYKPASTVTTFWNTWEYSI